MKIKKLFWILCVFTISLLPFLQSLPILATEKDNSIVLEKVILPSNMQDLRSEDEFQLQFKLLPCVEKEDYTLPTNNKYALYFMEKNRVLRNSAGKELAEIHFDKNKMHVDWKEKIKEAQTIKLNVRAINFTSQVQEVKLRDKSYSLYPKAQIYKHKEDNILLKKVDIEGPIKKEQAVTANFIFELPIQYQWKKDEQWHITLPQKLNFIDQHYIWKKEKEDIVELKIKNNELYLTAKKNLNHWQGSCRLRFVPQLKIEENLILDEKSDSAKNEMTTNSVIDTSQQLMNSKSQEDNTRQTAKNQSDVSQNKIRYASSTTQHSKSKKVSKEGKKQADMEKTYALNNVAYFSLHKMKHFTRVKANRNSLNQSGIIQSISVQPQKVNSGDKLEVNLKLQEEYPGQIQDQDTLTVTFPKSKYARIEGIPGSYQVVDQFGNIMGQMTVEKNVAYITFNDNVNTYNTIYGTIPIPCKAYNFYQGEYENIQVLESNFGISPLAKERIFIVKPGITKPDKNAFYYKEGTMKLDDSNHVYWELHANTKQQYLLNDIWIDDQVQAGQSIDWSSFKVHFSGGMLDGQSLNIEQLQSLNIGQVDQYNSHHFSLWLNAEYMQGVEATISYQTIITNKNQKFYQNNSRVWYTTVFHDSAQGKESDATVKNIFYQEKASLTLTKYDKHQKNKVLSDVEFKLVDEQTGKTYLEHTNHKGKITWKNLEYGNYTLTETKTSKDYQLNSKNYHLKIDQTGVYILNPDKMIHKKNKNQIYVYNLPKGITPLMPNTGGTGNLFFIVESLIFISIGSMIFLRKKMKT